jgi:N-acetylmuramoyl-L-alanine amidase
MNIIERGQWGGPLEPIGGIMAGQATSVTVHHPYPHAAPAGATLNTEMKEILAIHRYHLTQKTASGIPWAGIGYNWVITQNGNIYEGRGWGRVGAHAGTPEGNRTSIGVAFLLDGYKHEPTPAAAAAFAELRAHGVEEGWLAAGHALRLHRDWKRTDCPGPVLARWALELAASVRVLRHGMRGEDVKAVQRRLGVQPVTGYFGRVTQAAVRNFQRKHGLPVDGVVGPMTRSRF